MSSLVCMVNILQHTCLVMPLAWPVQYVQLTSHTFSGDCCCLHVWRKTGLHSLSLCRAMTPTSKRLSSQTWLQVTGNWSSYVAVQGIHCNIRKACRHCTLTHWSSTVRSLGSNLWLMDQLSRKMSSAVSLLWVCFCDPYSWLTDWQSSMIQTSLWETWTVITSQHKVDQKILAFWSTCMVSCHRSLHRSF